MNTKTISLVEATIAADYLEENTTFFEAVRILREVAFVALLDFCHSENWRYALAEPFAQDGYLYATDGRICLRIPTTRPNTWHEQDRPDLSKLFADCKPVPQAPHQTYEGWRRWPVQPIELPTNEEYQTGKACPICRGQKEIWVGGDWLSCVYCDQTGAVELRNNVKLGQEVISGHYWNLISQLPQPVWYREPEATKPIWFRFAGGDGLLMSIDMEHQA